MGYDYSYPTLALHELPSRGSLLQYAMIYQNLLSPPINALKPPPPPPPPKQPNLRPFGLLRQGSPAPRSEVLGAQIAKPPATRTGPRVGLDTLMSDREKIELLNPIRRLTLTS